MSISILLWYLNKATITECALVSLTYCNLPQKIFATLPRQKSGNYHWVSQIKTVKVRYTFIMQIHVVVSRSDSSCSILMVLSHNISEICNINCPHHVKFFLFKQSHPQRAYCCTAVSKMTDTIIKLLLFIINISL